jgi:hypothetical protein
MSADNVTQIAGLEPTFSAREAAAVLKRSYSWLDQRLRRGEFVAPDGSVLEPLRAVNGYRYFSTEMLREIAGYCYRRRWYSFDELKSVLRELARDVQCGIGDDEIRAKGPLDSHRERLHRVAPSDFTLGSSGGTTSNWLDVSPTSATIDRAAGRGVRGPATCVAVR